MAKTLVSIIVGILKGSGAALTARELAERIIATEKDFCADKMARTTKKTPDSLLQQFGRKLARSTHPCKIGTFPEGYVKQFS